MKPKANSQKSNPQSAPVRKSLFLSLPIEIISMVMNYLMLGVELPDMYHPLTANYWNYLYHTKLPKLPGYDLISLLLSHPTLYLIGISIYYASLSPPLIFSPSLYPLIHQEVAKRSNSRFSNGGRYDIFKIYPLLSSSVGSICIYDFNCSHTLNRKEAGLRYKNFLSCIRPLLYSFSNLTYVYIEIGHDNYYTLLVDLLTGHLLPTSLKSLSIIDTSTLSNVAHLNSYYNRFFYLYKTAPNLHEACNIFPFLTYLEINIKRYGGNRIEEIKSAATGLDPGSYLKIIYGYKLFIYLLGHLIFKHGQLSLQHLVLRNIPPNLIFDPNESFNILEYRLQRFKNSCINSSIIKANEWFSLDKFDNGMPYLDLLEVYSNGYTYSLLENKPNGCKKMIKNLAYFQPNRYNINLNYHWIPGFLRQESKHGWKIKGINRRSRIIIEGRIVIDCAQTYELNKGEYQHERETMTDSDKAGQQSLRKRMKPVDFNPENFRISIIILQEK